MAKAKTLDDLLPTLAELAGARDQRRSLASLAAEQGVSSSTYQRAFLRLVGESPKQYTRRLQLEYGALALLSSDASVLDVALDAGFESHEGFSRAFSSHFGCAPKRFRKMNAHLTRSERHHELIEHIGPCVGLFRSSIQPQRTSDPTMNYDITRQPIDAATFLYQEERCPHAEVAAALGRLLPAVFQHAMTNGIELTSPPTAIYHAWGPGVVTLRAGLCVKAASASDNFSVLELPAGEGAVTIHTGPYDGLGDAHAAVEQFMHESGLKSAGDAREVYLTDPGEVPDPKDWKTQIIWPIDS